MKYLKYILLAVILLTACSTPKEIIREVPVETIKTEYKTQYIHDSIYDKDSTFIYIKGDTVFNIQYKYKYIERTVHDTLISHDTIPQIVNTETTVTVTEKDPQWWPVWLALGIVLLYLLITKTKFVNIIKTFIKYIIKLFN